MRGRKLVHPGDPDTRPMRDAVRENLFNLIGPSIADTLAIDLFAGTGAVVAEAISRGAARGIAYELGGSMVRQLTDNVKHLGIEDRLRIIHGNSLALFPMLVSELSEAAEPPWSVFFCPPYALLDQEGEKFHQLVALTQDAAPQDSIITVESHRDWDVAQLPDQWRVRCYGINQLAIWRK